ncbi:Aspartyl aminopeptidase [Echinococcus granulosus]|nr:Aspartyl aminopeptidase [Echinococcus granulosus]
MHDTLKLSTQRAGVHARTERAPYQSVADALSTHAIARSAHSHPENMASVDPITPSTVSAVAATTTATASLSPTESNMAAPQPDPSPLSPSSQSTLMDTSTIPAEVSFNLSQQQLPPLPPVQTAPNKVIIKPEAPAPTTPPSTTPLKRPRHKPEERKELLEKAVRDVKEQKISMRKAASRYNIAKSSLCDYVRKNHIILPNNRCKPSVTVAAAAATAANNSSGGDCHYQHHHVRLDAASGPVTGAPQTSVALQPPLPSTQTGSFSFPLETASLLRATHTATPPGGGGGGSGSVLSRLESPWNNVSGLPTQVRMQNWSSLAAQGKSMSSLSQASAASSPKQTESLLGISTESNSPGGGGDCGSNNSNTSTPLQLQQHQLPSTSIFTTTPSSTSSFICAPLSSDVLDSMTSTTSFFASPTVAAPPPTLAVTTNFASATPHLLLPPPPPPPPLQTPTSIAPEALIPTPLSRSLASIYSPAPPQAPPLQSSSLPPTQQVPPLPSAATASQLPLVFPSSAPSGVSNSAEASVVVDSLQRLLLAAAAATATRTDGKQLLPSNLGDLLLDLPSPMGFPVPPPPAAVTNATAAGALFRKLQLPNCLNSLIGSTAAAPNALAATVANSSGGSTAAAAAAAVAVIARLPQAQMVFAKELINFINKSPSPFHVVRSASEILTSNGFRELSENEPWKLAPNDCVFVTKNRTSLFAIAVGGAYKPGEGFGIIGAHTDSPCLRLKPLSERVKEGFVELAVQTYGGGLWYTWFDRDLTLAGRCIVRNPTTGALEERLVHIDRPLACVPSLAIHLNRNVNKNFAPDPEVHLAPILCTTLTEQLNASTDATVPSGHPAGLLRILAAEFQCTPSDLVELELYLADTQPAKIGGLHEEFIHAPRLDNQFNAYASIRALVNSLPSLKEEPFVRVVCLYDHEEIGSGSLQGAKSIYTECLFRRVTEALAAGAMEATESASNVGGGADAANYAGGGMGSERCLFERTMARSFLLSADQSHAVHPSWPEKHEPGHKPGFHQGLVLKHHCSQNYATNGLTSAIVKEVARRTNVPLQEFVVRQDQPGGRTIGPIMASHLGVMTADIGGAQLAMHSCREMTCTSSVGQAITLFTGFFEQLANILSSFVAINNSVLN